MGQLAQVGCVVQKVLWDDHEFVTVMTLVSWEHWFRTGRRALMWESSGLQSSNSKVCTMAIRLSRRTWMGLKHK